MGYEVNSLRDSVNVVRLAKLDSSPSGKLDRMLFSTLNSVRLVQLLNVLGTEIRRLYLLGGRSVIK